MQMATYPSDPNERRVILVLPKYSIEKLRYEPDGQKMLLDEETHIIEYPLKNDDCASSSAWRDLLDSGLVHPGTMLIQNPFDPNSYEDALIAPRRFALAKHLHFSNLCRFLGAKEVTVKQIDEIVGTKKSSLNLSAAAPQGTAKVTVENEDLEKLRAEMHIHIECPGTGFNLAAAESLLRSARLRSDPIMRSLIEMRRDPTNPVTTLELQLSLSDEAKQNLNVAGRIELPAWINLSANYEQIIHEERTYVLKVVVRFASLPM
jgi:hypothetical protein